MDLKVILDATPEYIGKRTIKHVNQRLKRLFMQFSRAGQLARHCAPKGRKKYPLRVESM